jgi:hypothetical protein
MVGSVSGPKAARQTRGLIAAQGVRGISQLVPRSHARLREREGGMTTNQAGTLPHFVRRIKLSNKFACHEECL